MSLLEVLKEPLPTASALLTPAVSRAPTPAPVPAPVSTNQLIRRFKKVYMESAQGRGQNQAGPQERPLKCEDYFETGVATGHYRIPFATSFLRGIIVQRWHQYNQSQGERVALLIWIEIKTFLRKNFGDSRAFIDSIWSRVKRGSEFQKEEIHDLASHFEHLKAFIIELDANGGSEEPDLILGFRRVSQAVGYDPNKARSLGLTCRKND